MSIQSVRLSRKAALLSSLSLAAMAAGQGALPAIAQDMAAAQPEETRTLNKVTVTATKREQTLQDVPVAVSVIDDSAIKDAEIQDLGDLQSLVPSLRVGQLQSSANTNFVIRGFGNGANNAGIEPSVGVFIDGVYRSRSAAQIADLPNLQRVEVLRGPQSTLFGKNASAGVISIVTRAPQFTQQGSIEASAGNYNAVRVKGDITGPITDTLAYSLAGNVNQRDGYADDLATGQDVNQRDRYGLRAQLLFTPTTDLEIRAIADYDKIDEICCVAGNLVNGPTGNAIFALGGALDPEDPFSYEVYNNFASENDIENAGLSIQADYETDFATLTSITAYRTSDLIQNADSDFTSADLIGRNFNETNIETFTQEVRLTSNATDTNFDWMVGGFFFDETVEIENDFQYGADFRGYANILTDILADNPAALAQLEGLVGVPTGTFGAEGQGLAEDFGQDNQSWSLFGTLDFYLTDRLTVTVGVNYTEDEKDAFGRIENTDVLSGLDLTQLGYTAALSQLLGASGVNPQDPNAVATFIADNPELYAVYQEGAADAAQDPGANPFAALAPLQFLPPFVDYPNAVESGSTLDDNTSYTFRLAYDVTENLNLYGSYATGFKASSWNLSRDSRPFPSDYTPGSRIVDPFTGGVVLARPSSPITDAGLAVPNLTTGTRFAGPEEAEVVELGLKGGFDRVAFNLTVFHQVLEGFQSNEFVGTGFVLANSGKQTTDGIEFDATWQATDALTLGFAATLLDPLYNDFQESSTGNISGTQPSGISEQAFSTSAKYDFVVNNLDAFVRADWQYESEADYFNAIEPGSDFADLQALLGYGREINLVNASAGITAPGGIDISVWGRNIFNDEFITTAFPSVAQAGSISGYPNQPATYGVTVRKEF